MKNQQAPGFADLIEEAQKTPAQRTRRGDISMPFERTLPADHRVVDNINHPTKLNGVPEFDFKAHVEYFVIPRDEDKYVAVLDKILAGEAMLRSEDKNFTKEGELIIVINYLTKKENPAAAARRRREDEEHHRDEPDR